MAEQSQSEFMTNNNPYTSLPTRAENESLYAYLMRLAQARGGMLMGQYSPTVDDVVAEEITTQPLGQLVKNVPQGGDGDNNEKPRTPEEIEAARRASLERAVGVLTGEARPVAELTGALGPVGMLFGAGVDAFEQSKLENALEAQGFSPEAVSQMVENPQILESQLKQGNLGFMSTGYKQSFIDKGPSVLGLLSDFLGGDDTPGVGRAPGATSIPGMTAIGAMPGGAFDYGLRAPQTQGLFTTNLATNPTLLPAGVGTVYAPGYTPATAATGFRATSPYGFGMNAPSTGVTNTSPYGFGMMTQPTVSTVSSGGTGIDYQGPSPIDTSGDSGSVDLGSFGSYTESDSASNDWGGFGSEDGWD